MLKTNAHVAAAVMLLIGLLAVPGYAADELPEGARGFSGQVRGVVVRKGELNSMTFKVARVIRVWKGNEAEEPQSLVGRTVNVIPRYVKNDKGKWVPYELHVKFIGKLEPKQEITLELRNVEGPYNCQILELNKEQRAWARGEGEREGDGDDHRDKPDGRDGDGKGIELPAGARGFSGQVRGVVIEHGERHVFFFKVARLVRVWKNNKAKNPEAIVGRTVKVVPRWVKTDAGKWVPYELHVKFIGKLKRGQEITLELHNDEGPANCRILELSKEQRAWAAGEGELQRERKKRRERKRD